jgi:hypothetical protein
MPPPPLKTLISRDHSPKSGKTPIANMHVLPKFGTPPGS